MKKKYYWVWGAVVILAIMVLILISSFFVCIGCGTGFHFEVKEGCDIVNENKQNNDDLNFTLTDEILDSVIMEYGYPISGLKTGTLREFCQYRHYKDIEDCGHYIVPEIALICMRR